MIELKLRVGGVLMNKRQRLMAEASLLEGSFDRELVLDIGKSSQLDILGQSSQSEPCSNRSVVRVKVRVGDVLLEGGGQLIAEALLPVRVGDVLLEGGEQLIAEALLPATLPPERILIEDMENLAKNDKSFVAVKVRVSGAILPEGDSILLAAIPPSIELPSNYGGNLRKPLAHNSVMRVKIRVYGSTVEDNDGLIAITPSPSPLASTTGALFRKPHEVGIDENRLVRVELKVAGSVFNVTDGLFALVPAAAMHHATDDVNILKFMASKHGRNRSPNPKPRTIRWRKQKDMLNLKSAREAKAIYDLFPHNELRVLKPHAVGKTNEDYGGKYSILNFCMEEPRIKGTRCGQASMGWMYEADQKMVTHPGHTRCNVSKRNLSYLSAIRQSLLSKVDPTMLQLDKDRNLSIMDTMRVSAVRGAKTLAHTDSLRGITPSYVMFHENGGCLRIRRFPAFRSSVVLFMGKPFVPFSFSATDGLQLLGFSDDLKSAQRFEFPSSALEMLTPFGELSCAVVGIKACKLQVIYFCDKFKIISTPAALPLMSMSELVAMASSNRNLMPRMIWWPLTATHYWHAFESWRYIHCWSNASDHLVARTHVFFRPLRQVPTSANYIRVGKRKNYISFSEQNMKDESWDGSVAP